MTRPLPWRSRGKRSQPTATVFAYLSRFHGRSICHRLRPVATAGLHKGSIMSCLLWLHAYEPKSVAPGAARAGRIAPLQHQPVARVLTLASPPW